MELFRPYKIIDSSAGTLHLKESGRRKIFMVAFFRVLPFVFAGLILSGINHPGLPVAFRWMLGGSALLILVLFLTKKFVTEIQIDRVSIITKVHFLFKADDKQYLINDMEKFTVLMQGGKGGGMFYSMQMKDGRRIILFTIPVWYMKRERLPLINQRLTGLTSLEVEQLY